jgi:hypothetical protein
MSNSHLVPEARINKHGKSAIKYVRPDGPGSNTSSIPAPAMGFAEQPSKPEPVVLEGSMLSSHKNHEVLLGDFKKNADGSATITPEDMRMVQRMLSEAVDEDQQAAYTDEDGGNSVYFISYLMGQGDINALRTIYAKQGVKGNTVESVWHAMRILRQHEVCDKETNYGAEPGFEAAYSVMTQLDMVHSDGNGGQYDGIEGMEGITDEKMALLRYAFDNPEHADAIVQAVIIRETLDVDIISQIVDSGSIALADGFI